jgi:hypothetical protein
MVLMFESLDTYKIVQFICLSGKVYESVQKVSSIWKY